MVNGRIAQELSAAELGADRELQERLLGVRSGGDDDERATVAPAPAPRRARRRRRCSRCAAPTATARRRSTTSAPRSVRGFNRWNAGGTAAPVADIARAPCTASSRDGRGRLSGAASGRARITRTLCRAGRSASSGRPAQVFDFPVAASSGRAAYVAGTFDTKGRELFFLRQCLEKLGLRVVTVDLATSGKPSTAAVHPREVARHHPDGEARGLQRRSRQRRHRDGARLRALRR